MSEYLWDGAKTFNSNSSNWTYPTRLLPDALRQEALEQLKREEERSRRLAERSMTWEIPQQTLKDLADSMRPPSLDPMAILTPDEAETHCRQHAQGDHLSRVMLCPLCYEENPLPPLFPA